MHNLFNSNTIYRALRFHVVIGSWFPHSFIQLYLHQKECPILPSIRPLRQTFPLHFLPASLNRSGTDHVSRARQTPPYYPLYLRNASAPFPKHSATRRPFIFRAGRSVGRSDGRSDGPVGSAPLIAARLTTLAGGRTSAAGADHHE